MIVSLVTTIVYAAKVAYTDIASTPVELRHNIEDKQEEVTIPRGEYSFWLKMPGRSIENKDAKFYIYLFNDYDNEIDESVAEMSEDFNLGYYRNSYGQGQYYKIGSYNFGEDFFGSIVYGYKGTWDPGYGGELVIRQTNDFALTGKLIQLILVFVFGLLLLVIGVLTITRSRKLVNKSKK